MAHHEVTGDPLIQSHTPLYVNPRALLQRPEVGATQGFLDYFETARSTLPIDYGEADSVDGDTVADSYAAGGLAQTDLQRVCLSSQMASRDYCC